MTAPRDDQRGMHGVQTTLHSRDTSEESATDCTVPSGRRDGCLSREEKKALRYELRRQALKAKRRGRPADAASCGGAEGARGQGAEERPAERLSDAERPVRDTRAQRRAASGVDEVMQAAQVRSPSMLSIRCDLDVFGYGSPPNGRSMGSAW